MNDETTGGSRGLASKVFFDPDLWTTLIEELRSKKVVPVIGPELALGTIDGETVTIDRYVARTLAQELGLDTTSLPQPTVNEVMQLAKFEGLYEPTLYAKISRILSTVSIEPSPILRTLARITDFSLYVTLSYDTLLERAVEEEQAILLDRRVNSYNPPDSPACDLKWTTVPVVYYLLGRHRPVKNFAVSDGDLIDFMLGLHSANAPQKLLKHLEGAHILFLGGAFPDWLLRFLLRSIRQKPLVQSSDYERAMDVLADSLSHQDTKLVGFLSAFSSKTRVFEADAETFINELWRLWSMPDPSLSAPASLSAPEAQPLHPEIFICFASEDRDEAVMVADSLRKAGFRVFIDQDGLHGGNEIDTKVASAIEACRLFVPLLSRTTERRRENAYFHLEWHWAIRRAKKNALSVTFIYPIIIDDLAPGDLRSADVAPTSILVRRAPGGRLSPPIIEEISDHIRVRAKS